MTEDDYTLQFNTALSPDEEIAFQAWAKARNKLGDLYDYDLRGAWKDGAQQADNGHLPDTYKKPNHPTFSVESKYVTPETPGGEWIEREPGKWAFKATPYNVQNFGIEGLQGYFKENEPDVELILPESGVDPMIDMNRIFKGIAKAPSNGY